ncbi:MULTISPECIES: GNAT family N-acetyltransferase [Vibrio]|uniref:GCN5-related N-acetyltransferase n=1 Tax=Vibrio crassostreae TaxID=246167 RepID=A0A822MWW5_9VIBR|nr:MULTISPECIES: GNAT family N-acetyltransferase [Vibrio]MCC5520099.1 GNAT family N-acetyltransferase [Vibrio splendidus]MDH5953268.1 GNAT family N-acetyltransferase [Vibrio crassostreae]PMH04163.1 GNAT family N-acetyltransferase [Vibrio splendidus]PMK90731.1 GNAT family N-acetyltransferase [Vibrio lentus]PMN26568.1 GNAT family N-acetyltransferase [Vibrio splendidus]
MSVNIRSAEISDSKAISELILPLAKKYVCPTCDASAHDILLNSMSEENVGKYLSTNYNYVIAVTANDEVVGVAGVRDNSHLYHLFVDDNFQGNGLSRQLWEAVKEESIKNGNSGIFTVNSAVNAESVYSRFGFKRTEGIRNRQGMIDIPMLLDLAY